jgi:hypothetical protein
VLDTILDWFNVRYCTGLVMLDTVLDWSVLGTVVDWLNVRFFTRLVQFGYHTELGKC